MNTQNQTKIIHILCHTIPLQKDFIFDGWPARLASYIQKYSSDFIQECYFAVTGIKQKQVFEKAGIKYILFPAFTLNKTLESFFSIIYSPGLFKQLKGEVQSGKVVIHIQGERGTIVLQTIQTAKPAPVFIQFHGYSVPKFLKWFESIFISPWEKYYFKFVSHFFVSIKDREKYLINVCHVNKNRILKRNLGVDYEIFKPMNKIKIRKKLGIPLDQTVFLYVGHFTRVKGAEKIIDAYKLLKTRYRIFLIMIGGIKSDEYYDYASANADLVIGRTKHSELVKYFNAADAYCLLCPPGKARFGGMGVAPTEALACDKPILSSNLREAPELIRHKLGYLVESEADLIAKMILIIKRKKNFKAIRLLTEPFFSWSYIVYDILKLYKKVL